MIVGVGIDVVNVSRFIATLEKTPRLAERLFTDAERACTGQSLAARFAAKEALAKSLGAPPGMSWTDAEVVKGDHGAVSVVVAGTVAQVATLRGVKSFHVSLTHDAGVAAAVVIAEGGS